MEQYLKLFRTQADYEAASEKPPVSHIVEDVDVKMKEKDPYCGHEYVEIAGLKWATMNIGANDITDYGLYFQWGDTQGYTSDQVGTGSDQKEFDFPDYKFGGNQYGNQTKYNDTDGKTVLDPEDDAAVANWGCAWRMPTSEEFVALGNAVNVQRVNYNGVYLVQCTDKTDSSKKLYFPYAGDLNYGRYVPSDATYWSSTLRNDNKGRAKLFATFNTYNYWSYDYPRSFGLPIRPVAE